MNLRKLNIFVAAGMLITFIVHAVSGGMRLAGARTEPATISAWLCVGFICVHIVITTILTFRTLKAQRLSGAGYFRENTAFWTRRISGFVILIPLALHLIIFMQTTDDAYRLQAFTVGRLISQVLLVAAIALHVLTNIRPLIISLGMRDHKAYRIDLLLILSVLLLLMGIAFAIYYLRWMQF